MLASTSGRGSASSTFRQGRERAGLTNGRSRSTLRIYANGSTKGKSSTNTTVEQVQARLRNFGERASDQGRRLWRRLDSEHGLTEKAERAVKRAGEYARDVDQTWNVRRKVRTSVAHVQRMWPVWSAQLDSFASTWYGKATLLAVMVVIFSSPIFWRLLNILLIVWWLAIPIGASLVNAAQKRAATQAAAQAAAEEERRRNPFASMFGGGASKGGWGQTSWGGGEQGKGSGSGGRSYRAQEGPVIDAEVVIIEPESNSKDGKAGRKKG